MELLGTGERGYFWWADETIPAGSFAPPSAVSGTLKINPDGLAALELDGTLPRAGGPLADLSEDGQIERAITGVLANTGRHVRLEQLHANGSRFISQGPSSENLAALTCLVSASPSTTPGSDPRCTNLEISLEGFEPWLRLERAQTRKTRTGLITRFRQRRGYSYGLKGATLEIKVKLAHSTGSNNSSVTITQQGVLTYTPRCALTLEEVKEVTSRIADLLILLTDSERGLDWPLVQVQGLDAWFTLYYARSIRSGAALSRPECWTTFPQVAERFGEIADAWFTKHEEFGPGFHLYLGNRRGMRLYPEHRFVNLVWGLESLHRKTEKSGIRTKLDEKIRRILDSVEKKDRRWLEGRLRHAAEITLEGRLVEILRQLPLNFNDDAIKAFAAKCAKIRHDISHFGGQRIPGRYMEFLKDLQRLTNALDLLYHARILQEISISDEHLRSWFTKGWSSYRIRKMLHEAGLELPLSTYKPPEA